MDQLRPEQAIARLVGDLADAWNTHDAATFAAQFRLDAEFTDVVGQTARGRAAITAQHGPPFARLFRQARFVVTEHTIRVLTPGVASVDCRWAMTGRSSSTGAVLPPRHGLLHLVFVAEQGRWWSVVTATYRQTTRGRAAMGLILVSKGI